ncbi:hypothetical protein SAMN05421665_3159 [Yoonia rosea]|uniref:Uncharacterized protein n=1 Tax=Yoonia rosea TaxID=287098 RepID=A0A1R3XH25_9RHOB|nr:hypothetical protein [Yoonia rosea]SIT90587.1 hypothetical protein SAMN05421665_3159 [Yoonia rosea]
MIYIAVAPVPLWLFLLLGLVVWQALAFLRRSNLPMAVPLFLLGLGQAGVAGAGLYFTAERSISTQACMTGIIGSQAAMIIGLAMLGTFFALLIGARERLLAILAANKGFFAAQMLLQVVVILILMRSALLCTV